MITRIVVEFPAPLDPGKTRHDPRLDSGRQVIHRRFRTIALRKFAGLNHDSCPFAQYPRYG
jgi:hypothetical protein